MSEKHLHEHNDHDCHGHRGHNHSHNGKITIILFFIGLGLYLIHFFIPSSGTFNIGNLEISYEVVIAIMLIISTLMSGYHVIIEGLIETVNNTIKKRKFMPNVHILMTLAAIGAIIINQYSEAALLILIFAGSHYLEEFAEEKSQREIKKLLKMNPTQARRINADGTIVIIDVLELKVGDRLQVLNGDQIPTDGTIIEGESDIDEASITGESIPKIKTVGDDVFGSTMNGNGTFIMEVTKNSEETVFAKIIQLVSQTQTNVSKTAVIIKKIEPIYVTTVIIIAPLFYLLGHYVLNWDNSFYRTMVLLIGASPCALAATDIPATLSAISNLARNGILFKGGSYLANFSDIKAIAFDKTGTLTAGKPVVTDYYFSKKVTDEEQSYYLDVIVAMEKQSNHPLADAIINKFSSGKNYEIEVTNLVGTGLIATYNDFYYKIGKPSSYKKISKEIIDQTLVYQKEGKTVVYFGVNDEVTGLIAIQDIPKVESKPTIAYLKGLNIHTVMITGDAKETGAAIGKELAIDEVIGNVMPEDKANIIGNLKEQYGVVAMVGDGVNDAPALVAANIGVAMGDGTDIAIDVADAVLMKNDISKLVYTHRVAKKLRKIVWQNIIFAMTIVVFLLVMNIIGTMDMPFAVVVHEGSTLLVILNGLRLLKNLGQINQKTY